jgi:SAM-dependent methyltransferase
MLTTYYVKTIDTLSLLNILHEDALFGAHVFDFNGKFIVSRDLLDSIVEIYFLERTLGISKTSYNFLDIGAGYGRFAYRIVSSFPQGRVLCVDSVAESTFLCEYYLRFRGVEKRAETVPLDEIKCMLASNHVDVATYIFIYVLVA